MTWNRARWRSSSSRWVVAPRFELTTTSFSAAGRMERTGCTKSGTSARSHSTSRRAGRKLAPTGRSSTQTSLSASNPNSLFRDQFLRKRPIDRPIERQTRVRAADLDVFGAGDPATPGRDNRVIAAVDRNGLRSPADRRAQIGEEGARAIRRVAVRVKQVSDTAARLAEPARRTGRGASRVSPIKSHHRPDGRAEEHEV